MTPTLQICLNGFELFSRVFHRNFLFSCLFLFLVGGALQGEQESTLSVDVKVVNVLATVRDKQGQIVRDLNKEDFKLEEDGLPQTIRYFARETNLPLTLGLLVDTSLSQRRLLDQERSASYQFLQQVLREEKDMAFVLHFDREVELLQDTTSSHKRLETALASLETPDPGQWRGRGSPGGGPGSGPGPRPGSWGRMAGTLLYDAVFLASDELMKKQTGRKALIILSDGVDMGSKVNLQGAIEAAQRVDTPVYAILFVDEEMYANLGGFGGRRPGGMGRYPGGGSRLPQQTRPDGKKVLKQLAQETGGGFFEVSKKQSIEQIYAQIQEELRNQYSLGYTPDRTKGSPGYHKIHLTTQQKGLSVQTREGYYANW